MNDLLTSMPHTLECVRCGCIISTIIEQAGRKNGWGEILVFLPPCFIKHCGIYSFCPQICSLPAHSRLKHHAHQELSDYGLQNHCVYGATYRCVFVGENREHTQVHNAGTRHTRLTCRSRREVNFFIHPGAEMTWMTYEAVQGAPARRTSLISPRISSS